MFMSTEIIYQLLLATFLGAIIGIEREMKKREAGLQTYSLVALGACFFTIIAFSLAANRVIADPSVIIVAIAIGMGFIGAGSIFRGEGKIKGLTTAAGLWVTAAIGLAVGARFYSLAFVAILLALLIFIGFGLLEKKLFKRSYQET
jgi:putative Mg2+ transporter-C (MgtC) family protein